MGMAKNFANRHFNDKERQSHRREGELRVRREGEGGGAKPTYKL